MAGSFFPGFMEGGKSKRVSKPPGGDTNDIFDLEKRQRQNNVFVYEDKRAKNDKADQEAGRRCRETEDINSSEYANRKLRRSLSDCQIKLKEPKTRTPPLAVGKENLGSHLKGSLTPRIIMSDSDPKKVGEESDNEDNDELSAGNNLARKPITGDDLEAASRSKLEDTTNIARQEGTTNISEQEDSKVLEKKPRRPCIRVRQPPGGKSSIIF